MSLYAYGVFVEERERGDEDAHATLVGWDLVSVWLDEARADEECDVMNMDGVGSLTSRIYCVVVQVEVTERYHAELLRREYPTREAKV